MTLHKLTATACKLVFNVIYMYVYEVFHPLEWRTKHTGADPKFGKWLNLSEVLYCQIPIFWQFIASDVWTI